MTDAAQDDRPVTLKRALGPAQVILYGMGTMLGAGIYALVGEMAGTAGYLAPLAFLLAAMLALLTALSFAELASRFPKSAGTALYVRAGFNSRRLGTGVGLVVALSGIVSAGALTNAFIGYLGQFVTLEREVALMLTVAGIALIAIWGIAESVTIAAVITLIEAAGLIIILAVASGPAIDGAQAVSLSADAAQAAPLAGVFTATVLAFYAFIGFEDMVNLAEEVKNPRKVLPLSVVTALVLTAVLYLTVSLAAVLVVPPAGLAASEAPLSAVYTAATGRPAAFLSAIGLVAIINGAIVQLIMASRLTYGMARQGWLPAIFGRLLAATRTPAIATLAVAALILAFALAFDLSALAQATSLMLLAVFALVNGALLRLKLGRGDRGPADGFRVPAIIPALGALTSLAMVAIQTWRWVG